MLDVADCSHLVQLPRLPDSLEEVYLHGCVHLKSMAPLKPVLVGLQTLQLYGCRFDDLDQPLCGEEKENVAAKVRSHFQAIEAQGAAYLAECKVVVLGNGGVGKTSLVRALKGLSFDGGETSTEGIRLWSWDGGGVAPFPENPKVPLTLNIWDFGGQDLYHNTYRLFLESRAIFIIVWRQPRKDGKPFREDPRYADDPVRPLSYWFDQVKASNPEAQILLVRTWIDDDKNNPPGDWREQVGAEYQSLVCHEISCKNQQLGNREGLIKAIRHAAVVELRSIESVRLGAGRKAVRDSLRKWQPVCADSRLDLKPGQVTKRP